MEVKSGFKQTEIGVIPSDWEVKSYDEIFSFLTTATYSRAQMFENGDIDCVHYGDIHTKYHINIDFEKSNFHSVSEKNGKKYPFLRDGDIIMADASEDYLGIGKSVEVKNVKNKKIISGLHTFLLRDKNNTFCNGYRGYIHSINIVKKQFDELATGMKVYGVSKANLKIVKVPVPTLKEQTAIATALSDTDAWINSLEQLLTKKRQIKQGAMQELLKPNPEASGGWEVKRLGEIGKPYGGLSGKAKDDFYKGGYPYIPFMNIMSNPIIDKNYVDYVNIKQGEIQNKAQKFDLFFNGSSETPEEVGMCSVLLEDFPNLYLNSFCFGYRLFKEQNINALYLSYFFRSDEGRNLFYSMAQGATRYNLSKGNFLKLEIKLPTPEEQTRIATILSDMDEEIGQLESKLEKAKQLKQGMMQELLTGRIRLV